jgi:small subunit ribosomal protein S4
MTKRLSSKYSVCRKLKNPYKNLWGLKKKDSCRSVLTKKRKRPTPFGKLLNIKQSLKFFYSNLGENIFKRNIKISLQSPSKTLDKLASVIESRLDSVIFRSCFVVSFQEARQLINHRFVTVNNVCITSVNKKINKGDIIKIENCSISKKIFLDTLISRSIPNYLELDLKNLVIVFLWDTNFRNTYYPLKMKYSNITRYYR